MTYRSIVELMNSSKVSHQHYHNSFSYIMIFVLEKMLELGIQREPSSEMANVYFKAVRMNIHPDHINRAKMLYRTSISEFYNAHFAQLLTFIKNYIFKGVNADADKNKTDLIINKTMYPSIQRLTSNISTQYLAPTNNESDIDGFFSSSKALYYSRSMNKDSVTETWRYNAYEQNRDTVQLPDNIKHRLYDYCCSKITSKYSTGLSQRNIKIDTQSVIKLLLGLLYNFVFIARLEMPEYDKRSWTDNPDHYIYQQIVQNLSERNPSINNIINNYLFDDPAVAIVLSPFSPNHCLEPTYSRQENKSVQDDMNKMLLMCIWWLIYNLQRDSYSDDRNGDIVPTSR